jgi:hypothetical protein
VITKVLLKSSSLSIDLRVTAPENSKASEKMEIKLSGARVADFDYWSKTFNVPPGSSSQHFHVSFASCYCYEYRFPYLLATGLSVDDAVIPPDFNFLGTDPDPTNVVDPVIEQEILDLSDTDIGGGVFNLSSTAYPPAQQIGPAEWQWQNINPNESVSFTAESVSGKDDAESEIFQAGIILGVAGAAFILVVDHGFDMWSEARKRKKPTTSSREVRIRMARIRHRRRAFRASAKEQPSTEPSVSPEEGEPPNPEIDETDMRKPDWAPTADPGRPVRRALKSRIIEVFSATFR